VHRFDAVVHVLHDGTAEAVKLREELNAVRQQRLTRMRFNFVQLHSSTFNQLADGNRTSMRASRFVKRHPCVFARLQLLQLLPYLDVVIYVDVDTYVLDDLAELARVAATSFNETQWAGMVLEGEDDSWYSRNLSRGLPFYQPHGLNSGVWVVNITRCRQTEFANFLTWAPAAHAERLILGDQDVLNIYFHSHRHEIFVLPCKWNRRIGSDCRSQEDVSAVGGVLHGNREQFFSRHVRLLGNSYRARESIIMWEAGTFLMGGPPRWGMGENMRKSLWGGAGGR